MNPGIEVVRNTSKEKNERLTKNMWINVSSKPIRFHHLVRGREDSVAAARDPTGTKNRIRKSGALARRGSTRGRTYPHTESVSSFYNLHDDDNADTLTLDTEDVGGRVSQSVTSSSQNIKPNVQLGIMIHGNPLLK